MAKTRDRGTRGARFTAPEALASSARGRAQPLSPRARTTDGADCCARPSAHFTNRRWPHASSRILPTEASTAAEFTESRSGLDTVVCGLLDQRFALLPANPRVRPKGPKASGAVRLNPSGNCIWNVPRPSHHPHNRLPNVMSDRAPLTPKDESSSETDRGSHNNGGGGTSGRLFQWRVFIPEAKLTRPVRHRAPNCTRPPGCGRAAKRTVPVQGASSESDRPVPPPPTPRKLEASR